MPEDEEVLHTRPQPEALRALSDDDLIRLEAILPAAFSSIQLEDVAEFIPLAIAAETADVLVSRGQDHQIASVMLVNINFGAGKLRGRIDDVATHADSLRQGHAGAVLDFAIEWFRSRSVARVNLTSNDDRQAAHRLYESRGFARIETNQFQLDLV